MTHLPGITQRLVIGKTGWSIDFTGCPEIVRGVKSVLRGWQLEAGSPGKFPQHKPRAIITATPAGWHWQEQGAPKPRDWDAIPPRTPMRVITDVHDAVLYWYLAANPQLLCLHGAAVRIGGGLVCFPARGRAGKSTLTACFAAHGHEVFADDVLGLDHRHGLALGFLPRLRVPLAGRLSRHSRSYIAEHQGPADSSWIYLKPETNRMARLGKRLPVKAIVLLDRQDAGPARLEPARTVDILKQLIAENIIRQLPMPEIFDRLHDLARSATCLHLRYSDPDAAVRLLQRKLT